MAAELPPGHLASSSGAGRRGWRRRYSFVALGCQASLGPALSVAFGLPVWTKWLDELAVAILFGLLSVRILRTRRIAKRAVAPVAILMGYTTIVVTSGVLNGVSALELVVGWRTYGQFLLFQLALVVIGFDEDDLASFFAGFVPVAMLHAGVALVAIMRSRTPIGVDDVTGAFGAGTANLMGYYCGVIVIVCLCLALLARSRRHWIPVVPVGAMWVMATAVGSYLAFGAGCAAVLARARRVWRVRTAVRLLLLAAASVFVLIVVVPSRVDVSFARLVWNAIQNQAGEDIDDFGNPGRLALFSRTMAQLDKGELSFWLGLGPGTVVGVPGESIKPSKATGFLEATRSRFVSASIIGVTAETGLVGVSVLLLSLGEAGRFAWKSRLRLDGTSGDTWMAACCAIVPLFVLAGLGETTWSFQPVAYPFWALVAYARVSATTRSRSAGELADEPTRRTRMTARAF